MRDCISQLIVLNASERHIHQKSSWNFYKQIYLQETPRCFDKSESTVSVFKTDWFAEFILNIRDRQAASF